MSWEFGENEPRQIVVVEQRYDGDKAAIVIDMHTEGTQHFDKVKMAGKLRLHYERIANEWNLVRVENLTFAQQTGRSAETATEPITQERQQGAHSDAAALKQRVAELEQQVQGLKNERAQAGAQALCERDKEEFKKRPDKVLAQLRAQTRN